MRKNQVTIKIERINNLPKEFTEIGFQVMETYTEGKNLNDTF